MTRCAHPVRARRRGRSVRAFSLAEMLMAIFILGIGVISIMSLFPVGLTQQRRSADNIIGPTIAENALAIIRGKVSPEDFTYLANVTAPPPPYPPAFDTFITPTILGDWGWRRPAFFKQDTTLPGNIDIPAGSISIFNDNLPNATSSELHTAPDGTFAPVWNWIKYPLAGYPDGPTIIITQNERYFPMAPVADLLDPNRPRPRPEYVWDCMFRRFQGRMLVAIFVYRVTPPGGEAGAYTVVATAANDPEPPPIPVRKQYTGGGGVNDPWYVGQMVIDGTLPNSAYDIANTAQSWQAPGQWLVDQNNTIHRVLSGRRNLTDGPVELQRPVPGLPSIPVYSTDYSVNPARMVSDCWYVPTVDANGWTLTPVYVTVREL
jgi:hypothetical protein